jgi:squalene-hopene/tetraprenyl-beta-curcumene cyclase
MVYLQIAFKALGYTRKHPIIKRAERELDEFFIRDETRREIRIQPCFSPVWDTGIALYALTDCELNSNDECVSRAADWLRSKECCHVGDWAGNLKPGNLKQHRYAHTRSKLVPAQPQGAWYFEYNNSWYPDCDDTAMVVMALCRAGGRKNTEAALRGAQWLLAMQNDDGGWAAFDKTRHRQWMEYIPFADHNAMQDPSCPDITGRVLECLSWMGFDHSHPAVRKAIAYIRSHQVTVGINDFRLAIDDPRVPGPATSAPANSRNGHADAEHGAATIVNRKYTLGCWFGRWGVNYIYGTWQAVIGPIRCGEDPNQDWILRAGEWIKSIQKEDGSFGETANSYEDPSL